MGHVDQARRLQPYVGDRGDTSHAAAVEAQAFSKTQRERLREYSDARGDEGWTDHEAHLALGIERASLCLRRSELMAAGLVERKDGSKRKGPHRAMCQVWRRRRVGPLRNGELFD
jgi:hypothetical protein